MRCSCLCAPPAISRVLRIIRPTAAKVIAQIDLDAVPRPSQKWLFNDFEAAREMTRHLLSLGHRRIGYINGHPGHSASGQRFRGYMEGMTEAGLYHLERKLKPPSTRRLMQSAPIGRW